MTYDLTSSFPTLQRAPITEATIDFQVDLPPEIDLARLRKFHGGFEDELSHAEDRVRVSAHVQMNASGAEMKGEGPTLDALIMRSEADALVVQARMDGFSVHKLPPYARWDTLRARVERFWQRYVEVACPIRITRLGVRYINRIEMAPGVDFKKSILTVPEIAAGIPQGLPEYFMRLVIPHDSGATAIVTEASLSPTPAGMAAMLFDIDVFRAADVPSGDSATIWSILEELRAYKNMIFFNSITPEQMEKYT